MYFFHDDLGGLRSVWVRSFTGVARFSETRCLLCPASSAEEKALYGFADAIGSILPVVKLHCFAPNSRSSLRLTIQVRREAFIGINPDNYLSAACK